MKRNKIIAGLAVAGSLFAMSGAANAIAPAVAIGIVGLGTAAAVADANANGRANAPVAVVPATPATVVMGAPAQLGHYEVIGGVQTWVPANATVAPVVNYDHDADGVQNHMDRYPNDPARS